MHDATLGRRLHSELDGGQSQVMLVDCAALLALKPSIHPGPTIVAGNVRGL